MDNMCKCGKKRLGGIPQTCKICGLSLPPMTRRDVQRTKQYILEAIKSKNDMTGRMDAFKDLIDEVGFEVLEDAVKEYRKNMYNVEY